jgi:hypothetical protein
MVGCLEVRDFELDVLGTVVVRDSPKVTGRTTGPSGIAAFPGTMPKKVEEPLVSMCVMSRPIFFKVLVKRTLSPLPPSMRTLLSLEPATTGFETRGERPGSEKLVH